MEITTYLNDRPYRILDTGEGDCHLFIVYATSKESRTELELICPIKSNRTVIMDLSLAWNGHINTLAQ